MECLGCGKNLGKGELTYCGHCNRRNKLIDDLVDRIQKLEEEIRSLKEEVYMRTCVGHVGYGELP
jgi:hypothetical protein